MEEYKKDLLEFMEHHNLGLDSVEGTLLPPALPCMDETVWQRLLDLFEALVLRFCRLLQESAQPSRPEVSEILCNRFQRQTVKLVLATGCRLVEAFCDFASRCDATSSGRMALGSPRKVAARPREYG